jgi:hypothetical protein
VKKLHILVERLNRKEDMLIPKKVSTTLLGWILALSGWIINVLSSARFHIGSLLDDIGLYK